MSNVEENKKDVEMQRLINLLYKVVLNHKRTSTKIDELSVVNNNTSKEIEKLSSLLFDNITFIRNLGDVPEKMGEILMNIIENHDMSLTYAAKQMASSSEFYKNTISQIYPNMNIMQEWFSEFVKETVALFTGLDEAYVQDWMILKTQETARGMGKMATEMSYEERCYFGETLFRGIIKDFKAPIMLLYILRTVYIPYISVYYLRPFTDYPYYQEWRLDVSRYEISQNVREKMYAKYPDFAEYVKEFNKRVAIEMRELEKDVRTYDKDIKKNNE